MTIVCGALCSNGGWAADPVAMRVAQRAARYPHLAIQALESDSRFALYAVCRNGHDASVPAFARSNGSKAWLLGDCNYFSNPIAVAEDELADPLKSLDEKLPGRWLLIEYDSEERRLRATTDRLGLLWLYIAPVPGGVVFASDFGAIADELGSRLTLNREAILWELACGHSPANATIFDQIELAPPGATMVLDARGATVVTRRSIRYGDQNAGLTRRQKFELLDEILDGTMAEIVRCVGTPLTLSISGGSDSRYALGLLHKAGIMPSLLTFGHPDSEEVLKASEVCASIGQRNELLPVPDTRWDAWERIIKLLGNTSLLQWSGWVEQWLEFLRARGRNVIIGYLGDALTGKFMAGVRLQAVEDWSRFWVEQNTGGGWIESSLLRPGVRAQLMDAIAARVSEENIAADYAYPFQRAVHLNLYGRQRRWTGTQPNLLSRAVSPILPFFRSRVIDFWTNLATEDLVDQSLYLSYARSRFPALFPAEPGRVSSVARRVLRKAGRMGRALIGQRQAPARPIVIDRNQAIVPNKSKIVQLARSVAPLIEDVIDMDAFCDTVSRFDSQDQARGGQIIRAVNVFHLLSIRCQPAGVEMAAGLDEALCASRPD